MPRLPWLIIVPLLTSGCAGLNPNPGERTVDNHWLHENYDRALPILRPSADAGEPWAQLRLGVFYEFGNGVPKDFQKAAEWYKKAAKQETHGGWARGQTIGSMGKPGFFNQNSDALIAQYQLSGYYVRGDGVTKDLVTAYCLARHILEKSAGQDIFYCWWGGQARYITANMVAQRYKEIQEAMMSEQKQEAERVFPSWTPAQL